MLLLKVLFKGELKASYTRTHFLRDQNNEDTVNETIVDNSISELEA